MNRTVLVYSSSIVKQFVPPPKRQQMMMLNHYQRFVSSSIKVPRICSTRTGKSSSSSSSSLSLLSNNCNKRSVPVLKKHLSFCYYSSKTTNNCQNTFVSKISTTKSVVKTSIGKQQQQQQQQQQRRLFTSSSSSKDNTTIKEKFILWWNNFTGPKAMPERYSTTWYREVLLICTVFGITGSSTMVLVRPAVSKGLGIHGSFVDGPWSYRVCSIVIMTPIYATLLVCVGTIFGRHTYFKHFAIKIFSRFGIEPELMDKNYHITKKTFKKW